MSYLSGIFGGDGESSDEAKKLQDQMRNKVSKFDEDIKESQDKLKEIDAQLGDLRDQHDRKKDEIDKYFDSLFPGASTNDG